jgi:hypothetical protein
MNDKITTSAVLLALAASLALGACGSGDSGQGGAETRAGSETAKSPDDGAGIEKAPTIVVRDGEPVGGVRDLEYDAGDQIRFTVDSDATSEVHVHGYDLMEDVKAGGSASFSFPAELEGIFEVELEDTATQIAEITVNP